MNEIWKPVVGFEGAYEVSDHGRIRSVDRICTGPSGRQRRRRGVLLTPTLTGGYHVVSLTSSAGKVLARVHRVVATAFLGEPAVDAVVNHKNGEKIHNHLANLEWTTVKGNTAHSYVNGLQLGRKGLSHHNCRLSEGQVREIIVRLCSGESQARISAEYSVTSAQISLINSGSRWGHVRAEGCGSPPYFSRYPARWKSAG